MTTTNDDMDLSSETSLDTTTASSPTTRSEAGSSPCKTPVLATPRKNLPPTIANDTPIASVKRPGSGRNSASTPSSPLHPIRIMKSHHPGEINEGSKNNYVDDKNDNTLTDGESDIKADNIFSPVLQFINGVNNNSNTSMNGSINSGGSESEMDDINNDVIVNQADDNIGNEEESSQDCDDSVSEEEFNPYLFIQHLPPYQSCAMGPILPVKSPSTPPITLVLDLDETLVHCTVDPIPDPDLIFPVLFHGTSYRVHVKKRPYLESFLLAISKKFEVVCFTASQRIYADELLNRIDPHQCIKHRLFRDHCLPVEGNFLKDLNVLGRDLNQTILVDNSPHAFGYQVDNGIPIESWFDDDSDRELCKLEEFLDTLHGEQDVRMKIRQKFGVWKLVMEA